MNFLKGSLFRRNTEPEELEPMEESGGGILAVWGSPGCGKTVTAVKIAKHLAAQKKNTVLLLCDMTAPMMPCICAPSELEVDKSLGSIFAAQHISVNLIKHNLTTLKRLPHLTMLGLRKKENEYTYAPCTKQQAEELIRGLREIVPYLHPPVQEVFQHFLMRIKHIDPDMDAALTDLKSAIDNEVWQEWCDAVMACQVDRSLTSILTPIVSKLSDMRVVNAELENLVFGPRKEFITMAILVLINIPLVRFINKDWYHTLVATIPGQMVIAVCLAAVFVSFAFVVKLTQPIEYRSPANKSQ